MPVAFVSSLGMDKSHISPPELVINLFGGVRPLGRLLQIDPAAITRWRKRGVIPTSSQRKLLEVAWEKGLELDAHDIIFGRQQ